MEEFSKSFADFGKGVLSRWYLWVFALVLDPFDIYNRFKPDDWPRYGVSLEAFLLVSAALVLWASFLTYHELRLKTRPRIKLEIVSQTWGGKNDEGRVTVLLGLEATNRGGPTRLSDWRVSNRREDEVSFGRVTVARGLMTWSNEGGSRVEVRPTDWIVNRSASAIESGGAATGYLLATFDPSEIKNDNENFVTVYCRDINDREYTANLRLAVGDDGASRHVPGLKL